MVGGWGRKITNLSDRKKLKEIANEIDAILGAGLIVRTAGAKRTKSEIKKDYEYLQRFGANQRVNVEIDRLAKFMRKVIL